MQTEANFGVQISVENPTSITDYDAYCLSVLKDLYEGQCFQCSYIIEIKKINARSRCIMNTNGAIGTGTISVNFLAKIMVIDPNSILLDCKIANIDANNGRMQLIKDNINIYIAGNRKFIGLKQGQLMNVMIRQCKYPVFNKQIAANGIPYLYPMDNNVEYHIDMTSLSEAEKKVIDDLRNEISQLLEKKKSINPQIWNMYYILYYPYKSAKNQPPSGLTKQNIDQLTGKIMITRPNTINYADPDVFVGQYQEQKKISTFVALMDFYSSYKNHLNLLVHMCETNSNTEVRNKNIEVWKLHANMKKD